MQEWYVFKCEEKKESQAAALLEKKIETDLWSEWRILKKIRFFRSGGMLHRIDDVMLPGYILIRTGNPEGLYKAVICAKAFPQPIVFQGRNICRTGGEYLGNHEMLHVDESDLLFLQTVCGENLREPMGITKLYLDVENKIIDAEGILSRYLDNIVKLNLHKRFALVEVPLFNRKQKILFSVQLEHDIAG